MSFPTTAPETLPQSALPTLCSPALLSALSHKQVLKSWIKVTSKARYATVEKSRYQAAASPSGRYFSWPRFHSSSFMVAITARRRRHRLHRRHQERLKFPSPHHSYCLAQVWQLSERDCAAVMLEANWPRKSQMRRRPNQNV